MKVVIATTNKGKLKEFLRLSESFRQLELILAPDNFDVEESGNTFLANAQIKAVEAAKITGVMAMADDSGLEVDALNGQPGIYSARYCPGTDADRRLKLLQDMKDVPAGSRGAQFVCAMVLVNSKQEVIHSAIGCLRGEIAFHQAGHNGFGYDSVFYLPERNLTTAQLEPQEKDHISHRGQAFAEILKFLASKETALL